MPNYIFNRIKFEKEERENFGKFLTGIDFDFNRLTSKPKEFQEMGSDRGDVREILSEWKDFTKDCRLTPQNIKKYTKLFEKAVLENPEKFPKTTEKLEKDTIFEISDLQYQMYREIGKIKYGFPSWYGWSVENWGTKWNAMDTTFLKEELFFLTAWETPLPIFKKMVEINPKTAFQVEYYDENMGNNCGIIKYIPDLKIKNNHNVAVVTYDILTEELEIKETAFVSDPKNAERKYNAFIEDELIVYNDYTDYKRFLKELSEKEKGKYYEKWESFADDLEDFLRPFFK